MQMLFDMLSLNGLVVAVSGGGRRKEGRDHFFSFLYRFARKRGPLERDSVVHIVLHLDNN